MLTLFGVLFGVALSATLTVWLDLVDSVVDIWKPLLIFLGGTVGFIALFFLVAIVFSLCVNKNKPIKKPSKFYTILYNGINGFIVQWSNIKVVLNENEKLGDGPYLFVCNHRSKYDTMIMSVLYRKYHPLMISKPENFKIPVAGPIIYKSGFMAIDRDNDREALKTILHAIDYLKDGKYSVGVCPEGTRNRDGRDLLPFKNGAFKMATRSNVPIVVCCLEGTQNIKANFPRRTRVEFNVLKVLKPEDYAGKTTVEIGTEVFSLMQNCIDGYTVSTEKSAA